jgi:hypothetical protein
MIFDNYIQSLQVGGTTQAFIAEWKPNVVAYVNSDNEVLSLSETFSYEVISCGVNLAVNEEYSTNSKGSFIYSDQIQFEMGGIPRNIIPKFDGKRFIIIFQTSDKAYYIMGLDTGLRLQAASNSTGNDTTAPVTSLRISNLQRFEYLKCTALFVEDGVQGGIVDAPEEFEIDQ